MATWNAILVRKHYYKVQVEAEDFESAQREALSLDVDIEQPDDIDWDIYDLEEGV